MVQNWSRRSTLRAVCSGLSLAIAGCTGNPAENPSPTSNPTETSSPSPTSTTSPTSSPTESPVPGLSIDDFSFSVAVTQQFTSSHPARIEISLKNETEVAITLDGGVSPPFSSYWNQPRDDNEFLLIAPDMSASVYDTAALTGTENFPSTPTNDVCWHVTDDVTNLLKQRFTTINAGESLIQPFDVYDFQGNKEDDTCLAAGEYAFKHSVGLGRGAETPTGGDNSFTEFDLLFTLTIEDDQSITVSAQDPVKQ